MNYFSTVKFKRVKNNIQVINSQDANGLYFSKFAFLQMS